MSIKSMFRKLKRNKHTAVPAHEETVPVTVEEAPPVVSSVVHDHRTETPEATVAPVEAPVEVN